MIGFAVLFYGRISSRLDVRTTERSTARHDEHIYCQAFGWAGRSKAKCHLWFATGRNGRYLAESIRVASGSPSRLEKRVIVTDFHVTRHSLRVPFWVRSSIRDSDLNNDYHLLELHILGELSHGPSLSHCLMLLLGRLRRYSFTIR